jgi:hypothetical protein
MSNDLTNLDGLLGDLEKRREKARGMGGPEKLERRRNAGLMNARERVDYLLDKDTFIETGLLGTSSVIPEDRDKTPADGKICGFGKIDGRDVGLAVNDFTVKGSSTSATNSKKVGHVRRIATERGMPAVFIGESTGARLPDAMGSKGMGALLGHPVPAHPRDALVRRGDRAVLRLLGLARLLLGFLGDEEGLDHGGLQSAPDLHGDRRGSGPGGARRLAAACGHHRPRRHVRRYRGGGARRRPHLPQLHAEP